MRDRRLSGKLLTLAVGALTVFGFAEHLTVKGTAARQSRTRSTRRATTPLTPKGSYGQPTQLARLQDPALNESSGIVASRTTPGVYWTHNDSGDGPFIYSFDRLGKSRGVWRINGAAARDWEDIAAGPGPLRKRSYLYVGDIGDNRADRSTIVVYRVLEPTITSEDAKSTKLKPRTIEASEAFQLRYPDGKHDAETLLVHPSSGDLYVIAKELWGKASVYKAAAPLDTNRTITMVLVGGIKIPSLLGGFVTGGDISPDGRRVALCDYLHGYEMVLDDRDSGEFDAIWKQPIKTIDLGSRKQGEAVCYRLDGKALLTTSEGARSPLIEVVRH